MDGDYSQGEDALPSGACCSKHSEGLLVRCVLYSGGEFTEMSGVKVGEFAPFVTNLLVPAGRKLLVLPRE